MKRMGWIPSVTAIGLLFWSNLAFGQNDGRGLIHVFPQFADGRSSDGSYYRSTFSLTQATTTNGACIARLSGLTTQLQSQSGSLFTLGSTTINVTAGLGGWYVARSLGTPALQSGYMTLVCNTAVTAQVLYSFYGANNVKLSEATVFSSPGGHLHQLTMDQREDARLGLAIVNDTTAAVTVRVAAFAPSAVGSPVQVTIPATSNYVKFVDEIVPGIPLNQIGTVTVTSDTSVVHVLGLRFTGVAFTTIPATVIVP